MLEYKGYRGHVDFDDEAGVFHGEVLDTRDVITFEGRSVSELLTALQESIDDYLEYCEARGEPPEKPFSGRLMLRISSQTHRALYLKAKEEGKSLNQLIAEKLEQAG